MLGHEGREGHLPKNYPRVTNPGMNEHTQISDCHTFSNKEHDFKGHRLKGIRGSEPSSLEEGKADAAQVTFTFLQ